MASRISLFHWIGFWFACFYNTCQSINKSRANQIFSKQSIAKLFIINVLQTIKLLIWILILFAFSMCIFYTQLRAYGKPHNRWTSAFIYPITTIIWAINTATIIWMCFTGNGGLINKFVSWKAFIPLSRLTYSVYLTHVWIVWYYW